MPIHLYSHIIQFDEKEYNLCDYHTQKKYLGDDDIYHTLCLALQSYGILK